MSALAITLLVVSPLPLFLSKVQADTPSFAQNNPVSSSNLPIAVVISREIKPFIEMVEGFESSFDQRVVRIFLDPNSSPFSHDPLYKGTLLSSYSFMIAVGPSALSYIIQNNSLTGERLSYNARKVLYAMVLNPETIIPENVPICGISLNLFSEESVSKIVKVFPSIKKIGILFDPANNSKWFERALKRGVFSKVTPVPIHIKEQADLNSLNQKDDLNVDALLFIPDKTVTSPTIISHIIKQSIAKKIPVIGYNSFFHKSGAALSFILDYTLIGQQMAEKVIELSREEYSGKEPPAEQLDYEKSCEPSTPAYHITLNRAVVELLNLELGSSLPSELKVEP